jgi:thiosulfate/3-mercaptopyruvate sulfurtransferase
MKSFSKELGMHKYATAMLVLIFLTASHHASALQVPGPLVDADWLEQHLDEVIILDIREDIESFTRKAVLVRKRFTGDLRLRRPGAHIPGAVLVDFLNIRSSKEINDRNVRYMTPEKSEFEELMQSWGVNNDDVIVIMSQGTGNGDITMATRLYWQVKYFGHDNVAILDGGMALWLLEQKPASIEKQEPKTGNWVAREEREYMKATSTDVENAIDDESSQLVDTRSLGFYLGAIKQPYVRKKGHIPNARIFPNELLTSAGAPAYFADTEELQQLAEELAINTRENIITYCNSGQFASGSWFVFHELMGNLNVKLYDGSMHQWALEKRPVEIIKWNQQ